MQILINFLQQESVLVNYLLIIGYSLMIIFVASNFIFFILLQKRYIGHGFKLVVFYLLALILLIFGIFKSAYYLIEAN